MALPLRIPTDPFVPDASDIELAQESSRRLGRVTPRLGVGVQVHLADNEGDTSTVITLPAGALRLLQQVLVEMAKGNAVTVVPHHAEHTTQQAAAMLQMSRPHLVKLLEAGEIPFRKVGTHRRVLFRGLVAYQQRVREARRQALDDLAGLSQELGLYDTDEQQ